MAQVQAVIRAADPKRQFLEEVFLSNSIRDAFISRKGWKVYKPGIEEKLHEPVRAVARSVLRGLSHRYTEPVSEETHIQNIRELARAISERCGDLLNEGHLKFGVAQKLLNSWLKYLWCDQQIAEPPHCPFDSRIIKKLRLPAGCGKKWTEATEADYRAWVSAANNKARSGGESMAMWELREWAG